MWKVHVPTAPVRLQASHAPEHATLQQTPSVQNPEVHSPAATHARPLAFFSMQVAPLQYWVEVHPLASAGQVGDPPGQVSTTLSQLPAAARHTVPAAAKPSAGQAAPDPVHFSATSQVSVPPAAGRHTWVAGANASVGQVPAEPEQVSATSQGPADARHTTPAGSNVSVGQVGFVPSHVSARSQNPSTGRQIRVASSSASAGQVPLTHSSTRSQG